ncbi:MAG: carbonic anhydrase family protein [Anaerolineae bacterium]|nr:carbonic anhydrase family protein [Anaerolineae bacterium]
MKKLFSLVIPFLIVLTACSSPVLETVTDLLPGEGATTSSEGEVHWGYGDENGPENWGEHFEHCKGKNQSPINISGPNGQDLVNVAFHYESSALKLFNNGHTVQASIDRGYIEFAGFRYNVAQIHFHAPSEHHVEGEPFDAEFHIVHNTGDDYAVIGLLLREGAANPAFDSFINNALTAETQEKEVPDATINLADLLPSVQTTYRYNGSLTTPPCTESVKWLVMTTPVEVSDEQLEKLKSIFEHDNNRPVQQLNDRPLFEDNTP